MTFEEWWNNYVLESDPIHPKTMREVAEDSWKASFAEGIKAKINTTTISDAPLMNKGEVTMDEELRIEIIEKNGELAADIACNSDLGISVDLFGHQGHGKTKEEAIEDFKKNIFELSEEVERVKNRLLANIYKVQEKGVW